MTITGLEANYMIKASKISSILGQRAADLCFSFIISVGLYIPLQAGSLICYLIVCSILGYKEQGHLRKAAFAEGLLSLKGWPSGPEVPFL